MSEEPEVRELLKELIESTNRTIESHAEGLRNLRQTCAGIAQLLENHTTALKMHQSAIESLLKATGCASLDEPPENPAGPVN